MTDTTYDHDVKYGVEHHNYGTCTVCGETAGWDDDAQKFVHGATAGYLAGATTLPEPFELIATPGQFAARWNALTEEERELWMAAWRDAMDRSSRCFMLDHDGAMVYAREAGVKLGYIAVNLHPKRWSGRELRRKLQNVLDTTFLIQNRNR